MALMDKRLFTPGPLTTSASVKQAMLADLGSRDAAFVTVVREIREELLRLGGAAPADYAAVPLQGSGTFGVEAVLASALPPDGGLLVLANGAYGARMGHIADRLGINTRVLSTPEDTRIDPAQVESALAADAAITHVAVVHCETTTGVINPIDAIGAVARRAGRRFIVDAMSSFGAVAIDVPAVGIDYLVSSANKCIEGVPGFSFVIARREALAATEGWARSISLDLLAQWRELDRTGQFRFTPPTHSLLAFRQALRELDEEGGVSGRGTRYQANHRTLVAGMSRLGFRPYLPPEAQGFIITSFRYPPHPNFAFEPFYQRLSDKGFVIYPGKVSTADCFRIGTIGRLFPADVEALLDAIADTLSGMEVTLP
jgi:2-aminoethylphosphonate-pyruvate transaminase